MRRVTPSGPQEEVLAVEAPMRLRSSWMRALLASSPPFFFLRLVLRGLFELQNGGPERSIHRSVAGRMSLVGVGVGLRDTQLPTSAEHEVPEGAQRTGISQRPRPPPRPSSPRRRNSA